MVVTYNPLMSHFMLLNMQKRMDLKLSYLLLQIEFFRKLDTMHMEMRQ